MAEPIGVDEPSWGEAERLLGFCVEGEFSWTRKLGYEMGDLVSGISYIPGLMATENGIVTDFFERAQLQSSELNAMSGVNVLGGHRGGLDETNLVLDEGVDLVSAAERFGDVSQQLQDRQPIDGG